MARTITGKYIDQRLRQRGSPLAGEGQTFIDVAVKYDLDPLLLVAISGAESEYGKRVKSGTYNPFGWGPHIPFPSWGAAIETVGRGLRRGYLNEGLETIPEIGAKWAPIGAGNDPTNLNSNWAGNVSRIFGELGGAGFAPAKASGPSRVMPVGPETPTRGTPQPQASAPALNPVLADIFRQNQELIGIEPLDLGALNLPTRPIAAVPAANGDVLPVVTDSKSKKLPRAIGTVVEMAREYLGTPYVWGGESMAEGGFDCSGFLQFLWGKQGVEIPRVTYDQWRAGKAVAKGRLREGDAVFFRMEATGPGHVGMYIGNGKFIHAPKTGDVIKISSLNDSYYRRNYAGARRFS